MEIDHIFIFSTDFGKEADDLIDFGFTEGSSRVHPGQGTKNRKFYFENFFLEILWVVDEEEIQSELTAVTKLWERSQFLKNGYSPFGLCLANSSSTDELFKNSKIYQPNYFPKGMSIDILTNEQYPKLPWTFRLPYRGNKKTHSEPTEHKNGIKSLTKAEFEIPIDIANTRFTTYFEDANQIAYRISDRTHVTLEFDDKIQGKEKLFPKLNLTLKY